MCGQPEMDQQQRMNPMNATQLDESQLDDLTSDDAPILITPRRTRIDPSHFPGEPELPTGAAAPADARPQYTTELPADLPPEYAPDFVASAHAVVVPVEETTLSAEPAASELALLEFEEPTQAMIDAVMGQNIELRREQLQFQVAQLAAHLRERLREVDRREGQLNARAGELEADMRASRMWLNERELQFQERESELVRRIEELQDRSPSSASEVGPSAADFDARESELNERERHLQHREAEIRERRFETDRQSSALCHAQQVWQQQREQEERQLALERRQMAEGLEQIASERDGHLRAAEQLLNEHAEQLDRDRTALAGERKAWDEQKARQKQAIDELRTAAEAELADRRARLDARQDWVERQKAGLEQVRDEALRLHRQSLEMRLLAEQLWSQCMAALNPVQATQAIAQLRLKLAEQYRMEEEQLAARRDELVQLGERLAEQHLELSQLRGGVREWVAARQAEIEQQAATLVERELALDAQQEELRQMQQQWNADRRRYEQQIRDLASQHRPYPAAA